MIEKIFEGIGYGAHRVVRRARLLSMSTRRPDASNVAVMCVGFLRYGAAQAIGLQSIGLRVTLYYVDRRTEFAASGEDRATMLADAQAAGVTVVRVPPRRLAALFTDAYRLHRDLRRRGIQTAVVQSHADPRYATIGITVPVAMMLHDPQPHSGDAASALPIGGKLIARIAELGSACIIVHSPRLLDQVRPVLRRLPIGVVSHGARMAPAPAPVPAERQLLVFGRLFAYKGVDTALAALRALPSRMEDVKLVVAGRGPLANVASGQRGVEVRDEYIDEEEVDSLLRSSRMVLLPYKDATQSGVGLQALARGIPCVVSSVGGLPELVEGAASTLVVPPGDAERLAGAIVEHIDHDETLRWKIYRHAEQNFAWPVVAEQLRTEVDRLVFS